MALQKSAAAVLGTVRDQERARRTCPRPAVARLDGDRYLALHQARTDSDPASLFRAERQALPLVRLHADHASDREQRHDSRRNHRRTRRHAVKRAGRPGPGPLRAARDAKTARPRIHVKIVFGGHVDHGKSTLIGRILEETGSLPEGKLEALRASCKAEGRPFEYAFVLDALAEEQQQNVTIDTTQIQFRTAARNYVIIDAPGHEEFLKNMITGAASADAAVIVIAADEGAREQSRRHGQLLKLLGIRQVIVAVNKMDLVNYAEPAFQQIEQEYGAFLRSLGLTARAFIPVSSATGANIGTADTRAMPWFKETTLVRSIDDLEAPRSAGEQPLRFPLQASYR